MIRKPLGVVALIILSLNISIQGFGFDRNDIDSLKSLLVDSKGVSEANLLNELCRKYWVISVDTSIQYGRKALEAVKKSSDLSLRSTIERNLGTSMLYDGNYEEAFRHYSNSLEICEELGDKIGANKSVNNIGLVYKNIGNYSKALKFYLESLALKKELKDFKGIGNTLNNIGVIYFLLKDYDEALLYFQEALDYNMRSPNTRQKINSFVHLAQLYDQKKEPETARHYYRKVIKLSKENENYEGLSFGYIGVGSIFSENGNYDSAYYYFNKLLAIKRQLHNAKLHGTAHLQLADLFYKTKKYDSALYHLDKRHSISKNTNQQESILEDFKLYAKIHEASKNYQLAYNYKSDYLDLNEKIYNDQLINRLVDVNLEQQEAKHVKKINEKNDQLSKTRFWLIVASILTVAALLASYIYFNRSQVNKKVNDLLESKVIERTKMINEKNIELSLSNQELDNFVYKTSHDLRGPIARIEGLLNLTGLPESEPNDQTKYLDLLNLETTQMHKILDKLNKIHDINLHSLQLVSTSIKDEIQRIISAQGEVANETKFLNEVPETLTWGIDKFLFEIILGGLIERAQSNSSGSHFIKIKAEKMDSDNLRFLVIDNGVGIPEEAVAKIFDMFYQASPKSTHSGLVLYMAKKAVEKFGGEIKVLSPQNNTVFEFSIPSLY